MDHNAKEFHNRRKETEKSLIGSLGRSADFFHVLEHTPPKKQIAVLQTMFGKID